MASQERDRLLGHAYDGIEEYDNPLPGWWVWIFWATIVFSVVYWGYYHLGPGQTVEAIHDEEVRVAAAAQQARAAAVAPATGPAAAGALGDEGILALRKDAAAMARAREIFGARCAACHGPQAQGVIGPNLTDDFWIHGAKPTDVYRIIAEGVPAKGMVPWKDQLAPADIGALAAWIGTLRGTNPPNPKAPEGQKS
jgi:cytochrome c oxidase cbb3-type subunit 3